MVIKHEDNAKPQMTKNTGLLCNGCSYSLIPLSCRPLFIIDDGQLTKKQVVYFHTEQFNLILEWSIRAYLPQQQHKRI
uniref:Uncharacterized protein n=1 Tax=Romanomermis culicivorax TaxID=13658 RepID=A0A915I966_ROMCU